MRYGNIPKPGQPGFIFTEEGTEKKGLTDRIMTALMEKKSTLYDLFKQFPGHMALYYPKYKASLQVVDTLQRKSDREQQHTFNYTGNDLTTMLIVRWLSHMLYGRMKFKNKQLYIRSKPDCGKTTFIKLLEAFLNIYRMPYDENFYDAYLDGGYHMCVLDEFKGQKMITFLNSWLEGSSLPLRQKGSQIGRAHV